MHVSLHTAGFNLHIQHKWTGFYHWEHWTELSPHSHKVSSSDWIEGHSFVSSHRDSELSLDTVMGQN